MANKKKTTSKDTNKKKHIEFSKIVLAGVMLCFFGVTAVGMYLCLFVDCTLYSILTTFVGSAATVALSWYSWKAKAENVAKIEYTDIEN